MEKKKKKKYPIKTEAERKRTEKKILKYMYKWKDKVPQERRQIYYGINDSSRSSKELFDLKKKGYVSSVDLTFHGSSKAYRHYHITKKGIKFIEKK